MSSNQPSLTDSPSGGPAPHASANHFADIANDVLAASRFFDIPVLHQRADGSIDPLPRGARLESLIRMILLVYALIYCCFLFHLARVASHQKFPL
jgi:hypothetical protein